MRLARLFQQPVGIWKEEILGSHPVVARFQTELDRPRVILNTVRLLRRNVLAVTLIATAFSVSGLAAESPRLLHILGEELNRNFQILKEKASPAPYFIAYEVTEIESRSISATLGSLLGETSRHRRLLDVTVRLGSPRLDNYHLIRGQRPHYTAGVLIALEDNPNAIRQAVWRETDRVYRLGAQRLIRIRSDQQVQLEEKDAPPDFSSEEPSTFVQIPPKLDFKRSEWETRLRKLSEKLGTYPGILSSSLSLETRREIRYLANTEGTRVVHGRRFASLTIMATGKAYDGMNLVTRESMEAEDPSGLPADEVILKTIERVATDLKNLTDAPPVDPYVAPAILSGRAAGVFFHEIFGHRVEGHRQRDINEGQTFSKSVGKQVLPEILSVVFDPTRREIDGVSLLGWYRYDDEGVKARPVPVVENGILKRFLMSRSPIPGFLKSNGHGRRAPGREVVSRQSNLIVESSKQVSETKLRQMLIDEIKRQKKEYGFYFKEVTGGFTFTGRRDIQAFKVIPLVVYRVFADGREDELVRGADIVGTPLAAFSKITATGDRLGVFNGYCGAESGYVPVSAVAPALLISELEVQRKESSQDRPPLLPRPFEAREGQ